MSVSKTVRIIQRRSSTAAEDIGPGDGHRVSVPPPDLAHSLADAFALPLGPEPVKIADNLWGQEPDVFFNVQKYWRTIQNYVAELFSWHGLDVVLAEVSKG